MYRLLIRSNIASSLTIRYTSLNASLLSSSSSIQIQRNLGFFSDSSSSDSNKKKKPSPASSRSFLSEEEEEGEAFRKEPSSISGLFASDSSSGSDVTSPKERRKKSSFFASDSSSGSDLFGGREDEVEERHGESEVKASEVPDVDIMDNNPDTQIFSWAKPADSSEKSEDEIGHGIIFTPRPIDAVVDLDAPSIDRIKEMEKEAEDLLETQEFHRAESTLFAAINLRKRFYPDNKEIGVSLLRAAFASQCVGKRDESKEAYIESIPILKETYGSDNFQVATALSNLAEIYAQLEQYDEAIKTGKEALEIIEKNYGRESEYYAATISNLGAYQATNNQLEDARHSLKTALDIMSRVLGRDNVYTSETLRNYIKVLKDLNQVAELNRILKEWKDNPLQNAEYGEIKPSDEMMEKFKRKVEELELNKKFDPEGFRKGIDLIKDHMSLFIDEWDQRYNGFDPDLLDAFQHEIQAIKEMIQKSESSIESTAH